MVRTESKAGGKERQLQKRMLIDFEFDMYVTNKNERETARGLTSNFSNGTAISRIAISQDGLGGRPVVSMLLVLPMGYAAHTPPASPNHHAARDTLIARAALTACVALYTQLAWGLMLLGMHMLLMLLILLVAIMRWLLTLIMLPICSSRACRSSTSCRSR